jgi:hypothetical protein
MSTDYAEKERDFIAGLHEDTGRDLAGWMAAISESGLKERNAIIDWLRHQGFQFAKASWLERIHHNGGRLIYADVGDVAKIARRSLSTPVPTEPPPARDLVASPEPSSPKPAPPDPAPLDSDIRRLLLEAKGLRPLAEHILREVKRVVPNAEFAVTNAFILISAPAPFAALLPGSKKLRLYANFALAGGNRIMVADAVNKAMPPFPEMLLLDDARSIDEEFLRLIRAAAKR